MTPENRVIVWFDGRLRGHAEPLVLATDHGLTVGDGVFEACELLGGRPFALTRHLERLERSAAGLGLPLPDRDLVRRAVTEVAQAWGDTLGRVRIVWTAGPGPLGSDAAWGPGTLLVAASAVGAPRAVSVSVVPFTRNERSAIAGLKTISYAENVRALAWAHERGGDEAIFGNTRGELCEGTGTNVFLEVDGALVTPPLESGCLAGVTRAVVIEWAREAGVEVREETLPLDAIHRAEHVALTSSTRGVVPVVAVDGRELRPGPVTEQVSEIYTRRHLETPYP
ncbi:branched-chain amino acid aminotransferase [Georgenia soli]|uniref:Branched-chain amino acid aminotransferase n=1 Tax=Georgenia soli TaxID=638953 RepID=A0A2A9EFU6_9MICO|nr:aminotransferase class IV [Georgenia soli]PFG37937.1 branched-chain amino acid aminotransferase [Georgenia soli]